ncbi:MAG: HEAT repeat domain-containing protein, partial [Phycisphaerae bacterium]|nr:HEAT repeat domain-containing protein [Gemmatimonadaceae bacterium]
LTAYRDTTGDGVSDVSEAIVTGLGFGLDFRGADHTTNGITLGIDGYIYIAVGDYGYRKAAGKDGTTISHRGGGVVRVRTDGTGLELYAEGTRNIYDLAVDPFLRVYTRDNTNDGDGWDIRLHYLPMGAHMGYPMYYKNFASEHMPSLADYGNGSGTGGLWVHDPGFPKDYGNNLYTADWLLNQVTRHPLTPKGGSFDVKQEDFVKVPHPADMAMDGQSNMFIASLYGGDYTYSGDTVGYVVRVSPPNAVVKPRAAIGSLSDVALRVWLVDANAEYRLQAQREILRRGSKAPVVAALRTLVLNRREPAYARVAAMFTLSQLVGASSHTTLRSAAADPAVKAWALRALVDNTTQHDGVNSALFVQALNDTSARVQTAALTALARMNAKDAASAIVPLIGSADATVSHTAIDALVAVGGSEAALAALNGTTPAVRAGALRALSRMHDVRTVRLLIPHATPRSTSPGEVNQDVIVALARLYHREADWNGEWWGTRPSFIGPYFAPAK